MKRHVFCMMCVVAAMAIEAVAATLQPRPSSGSRVAVSVSRVSVALQMNCPSTLTATREGLLSSRVYDYAAKEVLEKEIASNLGKRWTIVTPKEPADYTLATTVETLLVSLKGGQASVSGTFRFTIRDGSKDVVLNKAWQVSRVSNFQEGHVPDAVYDAVADATDHFLKEVGFLKPDPRKQGNALVINDGDNPLRVKTWKYDQRSQSATFEFEVTRSDADMFVLREWALKQVRRVCDDEYRTANPDARDDHLEFALESELKMPLFFVNATVYQIRVVSHRYDSATRMGMLAVDIGRQNYRDAYKWALDNIGVICSSKEVGVESGQPLPEGARFEIVSEKTNAANQLEITFRVIQ